MYLGIHQKWILKTNDTKDAMQKINLKYICPFANPHKMLDALHKSTYTHESTYTH